MSNAPDRTNPVPPTAGPLQRFLCGISESIFQGQLGVADVEMIDYLSDLLVRFSRIEESQRTRRADGRPAASIFDLLVEGGAAHRVGPPRRSPPNR